MQARNASQACCGFELRMARADASQSSAVSCQPTQTLALKVEGLGGAGTAASPSSVGPAGGAVGSGSGAGFDEAQARARAAGARMRAFIRFGLLDLQGFFRAGLAAAFAARHGR